ncbi:MAG: 1-deoxy-D-xylulose-5-phosphate reductoisomerase [Pseudomonadales bacterium]|nr:1-deoxy-D-xylulose-5-phosphate reductoisomerase [Pseudomonadales bacterium]MCP5337861.1 1-deoxy-D-xylulose-5-phosphate reductoisomerase [Pseudomonadales bacterium]
MNGDCLRVTVLGSTGSIGDSTLDVIARNPGRYRVFALGCGRRWQELLAQCRVHLPRYAVVADPGAAARLRAAVRAENLAVDVLDGTAGLEAVAAHPDVDVVMAAIVGAAGLMPTIAAARAGKRVLLANKEALVMAGRFFMDAVAAGGATLLPIDSEHNAIFQCLPGGYRAGERSPLVQRLLLTASGGPFRSLAPAALAGVTPEQAVAHPNWVMGRKISVDSATMMNKGLELIEACWLFGMPAERIEVLIHPQSVVHSLVEFVDGSVLAQLGNPDMRVPIACGLAWPERIPSGAASLDLARAAALAFEPPDFERFPCLGLALQAARTGGSAPVVLNAANEIAVQEFLDGRLGFTRIAAVIGGVLDRLGSVEPASLDEVKAIDAEARAFASCLIGVERGG